MNQALQDQLRNHAFLHGMDDATLQWLADCAELKTFASGAFLMKQNTAAEVFYLLTDGRVSLRMPIAQAAVPIETVAAPGVLGWSWLVPPYKWHYDAVAVEETQTITVHTPCILGKIAQDKALGCDIYARFMEVLVDRLHGAHMQVMDIYANEHPGVP